MSGRIATEAQNAAGKAVGLEILRLAEGFARDLGGEGLDRDRLSQEVGRILVLTIFQCANDVEWLNRVHVTGGIGAALGEVCGQWPVMEPKLRGFLEEGWRIGLAGATATFAPRGSA